MADKLDERRIDSEKWSKENKELITANLMLQNELDKKNIVQID